MNRSFEYKLDLLKLTNSLYYSDLILEECIQLAYRNADCKQYSTSDNLDHYYNLSLNQLIFGITPANVLNKLQLANKK